MKCLQNREHYKKYDSQSGVFKTKSRTALKYEVQVLTTQLRYLVFYRIMTTLELLRAVVYAAFYTPCQQW